MSQGQCQGPFPGSCVAALFCLGVHSMYFPMYVVKARFKAEGNFIRRMFHLALFLFAFEVNKFWQPGSPWVTFDWHSTYFQPGRFPISWRCLEYRMLMVPCYLRGCSMHGSQATLKAVRVWIWSQRTGCGQQAYCMADITVFNELPCPCNPHCCQDVRVNDPWLVLVACADDVIYTSERMALAWNVGQFRGEKRSGEVNWCFEWYDLMLRYVRGICISSMAWQYASRPHRQTLLLPSWNLERSAVRFTGHRVTWKSLISFWYFLVTADQTKTTQVCLAHQDICMICMEFAVSGYKQKQAY